MAEIVKITDGFAIMSNQKEIAINCITCKHLQNMSKCDAFPDGIPMSITSGQQLHDKPVFNDQGITWEPREEFTK